jgi:general secretion pathway protein A
MVLDYYKLAEQPFGVAPDPRYLFLSPTHREALASVLQGVSTGRGFTALIAKPGMGKTTILFDLLNMVKDQARTAFLFQSQCSPRDMLGSLLDDLGIEHKGSDMAKMQRKLNECLLSQASKGKQLVVAIDEAQNLDEPVFEVVRMLSNFETPREKLMHFILAGQPQLAEKLHSPGLLQLRQRISIVARLKPFTAEETQLYIDHRLRVAGYDFQSSLFTKQALTMIAEDSEGIPRNINNLCFNAMSLGCVNKQKTIDIDVIQEVLGDLDLGSLFSETSKVSKSERPKESVSAKSSSGTSQSPLQSSLVRQVFPEPSKISKSEEPKESGSALSSSDMSQLPLQSSLMSPMFPECAAVSKSEEPIELQPALLSQDTSRSPLRRWSTRLALASALVIVVEGGLLVRTKQRTTNVLASATSPTITIQESTEPPVSSPVAPGPKHLTIPVPVARASQSAGPKVIVVQPNDTLYRICLENFGRYDEVTMSRLRELNPWLTNPRLIWVGRRIQVPGTRSDSHKILPAAETVPATVGAGTEKP